jgi:hypothetical protein
MAYGRVAKFDPIRELAAGAIGAGYLPVGTLTLDYPRIIWLKNSTNADIYFSTDGVRDMKRIIAGSLEVIDITTNKVRDDGLFLSKGTVFYVRRAAAAPTTGFFVVEVLYAGGGI